MSSEDPDVALCLRYLQSDENPRASSERNIAHIKRLIPALKRGDGVTYNPKKQPGGPYTLFRGRKFTLEDDLLEARNYAAARIVPRRPNPADAPLPEGAWCYDAGWGWVVDHALGIWNDAKMWAGEQQSTEVEAETPVAEAAALSLETTTCSSDPDSPSIGYSKRALPIKEPEPLAPVLAPALKRKKNKDVDAAVWDIPTPAEQQLRTAAMCMPLRNYLKKTKVFKHAGDKQWKGIKAWCETQEGVQWLRSAGLDPLSFHRHHIKAANRGGLDSVFNCAFTKEKPNCSFGDRDNEWMRTYIGKQACSIADGHARWFVVKTGEGPDQDLFDYTSYL